MPFNRSTCPKKASGAQADATADNGSQALHFAAEGRHVRVVELLLARRADAASARRGDGATASSLAAEKGYRDVVKLLDQHQKEYVKRAAQTWVGSIN